MCCTGREMCRGVKRLAQEAAEEVRQPGPSRGCAAAPWKEDLAEEQLCRVRRSGEWSG